MTKYRIRISGLGTDDCSPEILPEKVERETAAFLWVCGFKFRKKTEEVEYHDTYEQARDALYKAQQARCHRLMDKYNQAMKVLDEVIALPREND